MMDDLNPFIGNKLITHMVDLTPLDMVSSQEFCLVKRNLWLRRRNSFIAAPEGGIFSYCCTIKDDVLGGNGRDSTYPDDKKKSYMLVVLGK